MKQTNEIFNHVADCAKCQKVVLSHMHNESDLSKEMKWEYLPCIDCGKPIKTKEEASKHMYDTGHHVPTRRSK